MAWYHDEANKQNAIDRENAHKQQLIQQSNFWANLRRQIESDVSGINDTDFWKMRLAGSPLAVSNLSPGDGYSINKAAHPSVLIVVRHNGDHVEVTREFAENRPEPHSVTEHLTIGSQGNQVYLQTDLKTRRLFSWSASRPRMLVLRQESVGPTCRYQSK